MLPTATTHPLSSSSSALYRQTTSTPGSLDFAVSASSSRTSVQNTSPRKRKYRVVIPIPKPNLDLDMFTQKFSKKQFRVNLLMSCYWRQTADGIKPPPIQVMALYAGVGNWNLCASQKNIPQSRHACEDEGHFLHLIELKSRHSLTFGLLILWTLEAKQFLLNASKFCYFYPVFRNVCALGNMNECLVTYIYCWSTAEFNSKIILKIGQHLLMHA